jgi:hypothetical protein
MAKRHLLLACSARKLDTKKPVQAICLYNGVAYKVLNKYVKNGGEMPTVWIISAKYGLIKSNELIETYNKKMNYKIARAQITSNTRLLNEFAAVDRPTELGIFLGKVYRESIPKDLKAIQGLSNTKFVEMQHGSDGIGKMLHNLKCWLEKTPSSK